MAGPSAGRSLGSQDYAAGNQGCLAVQHAHAAPTAVKSPASSISSVAVPPACSAAARAVRNSSIPCIP